MSSPHSERAHSQVGASSAYRWTKCPGSVGLLERHPMPTSDAAAHGTKAHELSEAMLLEQVVEYAEYDVDMIGHVREYVDWIHTLMGSIQHVHGQWPELIVERRFNMKSVSDHAFGTNDVALSVDMGPLHIIDLKYGRRFVNVEDNEQLMYYALGIIEELDLNPTEVHLWVYGPRMAELDNPATHWQAPMERLLEYHEELKAGAKRVDTHPEEYVPGESQCFYCNKAECPAIQQQLNDAFTDVEPIQMSVKGAPVLTDMNTEDLVKYYKWKQMFDGFFRDCAVILKHRKEQGEEVPGYKLVRSFGHRAFKADVSTKQIKSLGLTAEEVHKEPERKSPAQIEKTLKSKYPARKEEDRKKRASIMAQFNQMVEKPERDLKLVDVDQPGEPVTPALKFDDVPQMGVDVDLGEVDEWGDPVKPAVKVEAKRRPKTNADLSEFD